MGKGGLAELYPIPPRYLMSLSCVISAMLFADSLKQRTFRPSGVRGSQGERRGTKLYNLPNFVQAYRLHVFLYIRSRGGGGKFYQSLPFSSNLAQVCMLRFRSSCVILFPYVLPSQIIWSVCLKIYDYPGIFDLINGRTSSVQVQFPEPWVDFERHCPLSLHKPFWNKESTLFTPRTSYPNWMRVFNVLSQCNFFTPLTSYTMLTLLDSRYVWYFV